MLQQSLTLVNTVITFFSKKTHTLREIYVYVKWHNWRLKIVSSITILDVNYCKHYYYNYKILEWVK